MNLFPALVTIEGESYESCRVLVGPAGTTVYFWPKARRGEEPEILAQLPSKPSQQSYKRWTLEAEDGGTIMVAAQSGCGCGHPGKRWRPPESIRVG